MPKILINRNIYPFDLSAQALTRLQELAGDDYKGRETPRQDPHLLQVFEEIGNKTAAHPQARLTVVTVPDDVSWHIVQPYPSPQSTRRVYADGSSEIIETLQSEYVCSDYSRWY